MKATGNNPAAADLSDHDLLIRIDERVNKLDRCMNNHLRHHWVVTTAALGALLTAMGGIVILLVRLAASGGG